MHVDKAGGHNQLLNIKQLLLLEGLALADGSDPPIAQPQVGAG